jgi:putative peptide zinc metalloprotease protein
VATVLLASLLIESVVRTPVAQRPHPLLRGVVAAPALLLVVVGALFQPARTATLPHVDLAAWIAAAPAGDTVSVPAQIWGDLVRDGVAPARLLPEGSAGAGRADWAVDVGRTSGTAPPVARFGSGPSALVVLGPAHVRAQ